MTEGGRLKGEVTLVLAPGEDEVGKISAEAKGLGFDISKDSQVNVSMLSVAETLNGQVEMTEHELRELLK